jgi:2-succinyl-6-hydroxy-2,4-cyclohexadiene-1-carboxylate synthase
VSVARTVSVRGLEYGALVEGDPRSRVPVVLLHGFAGSGGDWSDVIALLGREGYPAIAPDLPGHGATAPPADPGRCAIGETAADLVALVAALGAPRAHWAGYSMGGRVALRLAIGHSAAVASLLLESASPGIESSADRAARRASDEALAREIEARGIEWFAEHWAAQSVFATQRALPAEVLSRQREGRFRASPAGLAASLRGLGQGAQPWLGGEASRVACRALLLTGALDSRYGAIADRMAAAMPRASRAVVPEAGHNIHLERPDAFGRALLAHLARAAEDAPAAPPAPAPAKP